MNTYESKQKFGNLREYRKNYDLKVSNVSDMETYRNTVYYSYKKDGKFYTDILKNNVITTQAGFFNR